MSLLERLAHSNSTPAITGEWMTIQWTPDTTTKECFNLGVVLKTNNDMFIRTIDEDNFERFGCIFDQEMKLHAKRITKLAEVWANEGCTTLSNQLIFDNRGFIRGKNASQLINHLFEIAVPLGRPREVTSKRKNSGFHSFNLQCLTNGLIDELKRQDHNGIWFDDIIPHSRHIEINKRFIHAPLRPKNHKVIGNWASVVFADPARVKTDYLQSINDLRTASDQLKRSPALFLLKPDQENLNHLSKSRSDQLDDVIDKLDSTLKPQGIELYSSTTLEGLATEIYQWDRFSAA